MPTLTRLIVMQAIIIRHPADLLTISSPENLPSGSLQRLEDAGVIVNHMDQGSTRLCLSSPYGVEYAATVLKSVLHAKMQDVDMIYQDRGGRSTRISTAGETTCRLSVVKLLPLFDRFTPSFILRRGKVRAFSTFPTIYSQPTFG